MSIPFFFLNVRHVRQTMLTRQTLDHVRNNRPKSGMIFQVQWHKVQNINHITILQALYHEQNEALGQSAIVPAHGLKLQRDVVSSRQPVVRGLASQMARGATAWRPRATEIWAYWEANLSARLRWWYMDQFFLLVFPSCKSYWELTTADREIGQNTFALLFIFIWYNVSPYCVFRWLTIQKPRGS